MDVRGFWAWAAVHGASLDWAAVVAGASSWAELESDPARHLPDAVVLPHRLADHRITTRGVALTLADERYPASLRLCAWPPPVLFVEGDVAALEHGIAVVGTRACTSYGRGVAHHLGRELAEAGFSVVSGLARGVDAAAHRGALAAGRTVAVLGHGLSHTAPASHRELRREILARGGAVVSGFPDDLPPRPHTFPIRNRWIVGLATAVVVVEAGERSGAGITARLAFEADRDVYAVPGPLGVPQSRGCNRLLREGAAVVDDVASFVSDLAGRALPPRDGWMLALFRGASIEEVARMRGCSIIEILAELSRCEVEGSLVSLPGHRFGPGAV